MIGLTLSAELEGVTDLHFKDSPNESFEFTFKIQCTSCHEIHENPVRINQYETYDIQGSRGEATFVFRCKLCKRESSANLKINNKHFNFEDQLSQLEKGQKFKPVVMVEIDARGIDFVEFIPVGTFVCSAVESSTVFDDVELEDGEWYDYDEKGGNEVSITNVKWDFVKL